MENLFERLQSEVSKDPISVLNLVLIVFTTVSFTKLVSDVCTGFCCVRKPKIVNETLGDIHLFDKKLEMIDAHLYLLKAQVQRIDNYVLQIHHMTCLQQGDTFYPSDDVSEEGTAVSQEEELEQTQDQEQTQAQEDTENSQELTQEDTANSQEQTQQEQTQEQEQEQEQELQPLRTSTVTDKHSQLLQVLKEGETVSIRYKKQVFDAVFKRKQDALHGYVIKAARVEYNTPSHFSHAKKLTLNDKIKSDNGWDSVYVMRQSKKVSLNELIATLE